ncbi:hypothetical protein KC957_04460, partial [Candidatus Saccharibacteria bacterium]|nr:hypothetical protein [Candidatus Saccharibacteria bacterium]
MNPDTPSSSTSLQPSTSPEPMDAPSAAQPGPQPTKTKKGRLKVAIIAAVAAVVVLGGSAAAYFGIVVPNQPENKLKKAVENLSKQETLTTKGTIKIDAEGTSASIAVNMLHVDPAQKVALADFAVTVSGVTVPAELRYIDNNVYVKLGDVSTLKALASGYADSQVVDQIASKVSNQWIEIDQTLLKQASSSADTNMTCSSEETFTKAKAAMSESLGLATDDEAKAYTISKVSKEDVDGVGTTKLELSLDKTKLKEFGKKAEELQSVKD